MVFKLNIGDFPFRYDKESISRKFRTDRVSRPRLVVYKVTPGGQAERLGVKTGDILVSYDGKDVRTLEGLHDAKAKAGSETVKVVFKRDGKKMVFTMKRGAIGVFRRTIYTYN